MESVILYFFILALAYVVHGDLGWVRICSSTQGTWQLTSEECSRGIWFKNPFVLDCICVYGVWVINRGFCDQLGSLIVGTGECFAFNESWQEIRSIKYVGDPMEAYRSQVLVGSRSMDFFEVFPKFGQYEAAEDNSVALIFINTRAALEGTSDDDPNIKECFKSARKSPVRVSFPAQSTRFKMTNWDNCSSAELANSSNAFFDLNFNEYYENNAVYKSDSFCTQTCSKPRKQRQVQKSSGSSLVTSKKPFSSQAAGRAVLNPISGSSRNSGGFADYRRPMPLSTTWESAPRKSYSRPAGRSSGRPANGNSFGRQLTGALISNVPMTEDDNFKPTPLKPVQHREIAEQTLRLMRGHLSSILRNRTQPGTNLAEFQYLEYSRDIFLKVCPMRKVTLFVVNGLFRMFRTVFMEAIAFYPFSEDFDKSRIQATLDGLKICLNKSQRSIRLVYEPCAPKKVAFGTYLLQNGTVLNINTSIPVALVFDLKSYDMAVEMAWKMFTFTVYHCDQVFANNTALYSNFLVQSESMFNSKGILMRWLNPGKSLEINRLLFANFDLSRIASEVDSCVIAAKAVSSYPSWIQRKKRYVQKRKRSIDNLDEIWDGRGYCMQDYKDPVQKFGYQMSSNCNAS